MSFLAIRLAAAVTRLRSTNMGVFMRLYHVPLLCTFLTLTVSSWASIFGSIRGVVHDPQHRPVENAMVMLHAKASDWVATTTTDGINYNNHDPV